VRILISQLLPFFSIAPEDIILRFNKKKEDEDIKILKNDFVTKFPQMKDNISKFVYFFNYFFNFLIIFLIFLKNV
jgi:hypothetical protein